MEGADCRWMSCQKVPDLVAHERMSQGDKSRLASVSSWCLCTFLFSRLCAYRGTHARNVTVCVEKGWSPPPPFSQRTFAQSRPLLMGGSPWTRPAPQAVKCDRSPLAMRSCST